jgi:hypothetical protein
LSIFFLKLDIRYKVSCAIDSVSEEKKVVKVVRDGSTATYKETEVKGSTHIMTNDDEDLKIKALRAGDAVTDLVDSTLDKAADAIKTKANELIKSGALEPGYVAAKKDSEDIGRLGSLVTDLAATFEDTMTVIREHPYEEQVKLLTGYKKLIEEQISVIDSQIHFVKRVH